jgi:hypothetical protein
MIDIIVLGNANHCPRRCLTNTSKIAVPKEFASDNY